MKKLPDVPKFCRVCLAGPALNDNTASVETVVGSIHAATLTCILVVRQASQTMPTGLSKQPYS